MIPQTGRPIGETRVNWDSPLAKGLQFWFPGNSPLPLDVISGVKLTPSASAPTFDRTLGPAFRFTAASSQYFRLPFTPVDGYPLSIAVWFADLSSSTRDVVSLGDAATANNLFQLQTVGGTAGRPIRARVVDNAAGTSNGQSAVLLNAPGVSEWVHAVGVFPRTNLRIAYQNGHRRGQSTASRTVGTLAELVIGAQAGSPISLFFNGYIRDVCVWNRPLGEDEVLRLYNPATRFELYDRERIYRFIGFTGGGTPITETPAVDKVGFADPAVTGKTGWKHSAAVDLVGFADPATSQKVGWSVPAASDAIGFADPSVSVIEAASANVEALVDSVGFADPSATTKAGWTEAPAVDSMGFADPGATLQYGQTISLATDLIGYGQPEATETASALHLANVDSLGYGQPSAGVEAAVLIQAASDAMGFQQPEADLAFGILIPANSQAVGYEDPGVSVQAGGSQTVSLSVDRIGYRQPQALIVHNALIEAGSQAIGYLQPEANVITGAETVVEAASQAIGYLDPSAIITTGATFQAGTQSIGYDQIGVSLTAGAIISLSTDKIGYRDPALIVAILLTGIRLNRHKRNIRMNVARDLVHRSSRSLEIESSRDLTLNKSRSLVLTKRRE